MFKIDKHTFYGLLAILLWSTIVAVIRSLSEKIGSLTTVSYVHALAGLFCIIQLAFQKGIKKKFIQTNIRYFFVCGALFIIYMLALFLSIGLASDRQQALEMGLLNYLWPSLTIVLSLFLLKKTARIYLFPATVIALLGEFFVITHDASFSLKAFFANIATNPLLYVIALTAAISWALYSNLARRLTELGDDGAVPIFIIITGIVMCGLKLFFPETSHWNVAAVIELVYLSVTTVISYILWDLAMRKGQIVFIVAFSYFTPLLSILFSCVYLDVFLGTKLVAGCLLLVAGSLLSWSSVDD